MTSDSYIEPPSRARRARPLLGTLVEIALAAPVAAQPAAFAAAFAAIERVQRRMSFHDPASDVARINAAAAGRVVEVDPQTVDVLRRAAWYGALSGGTFDVVVGDVLVAQAALPRPEAAAAPDPEARQEDLDIVDATHVAWGRRRGWIDLGGIAKGFAVDRAVDALREQGIVEGCVNAGGDLRCFGGPAPIHVRHPERPGERLALGDLEEAALATSANVAGAGIAAPGGLVDPQRRAGARWPASVSVIADRCVDADALTKIVGLAPERALPVLDAVGAGVILVRGDAVAMLGRVRIAVRWNGRSLGLLSTA